MSSLNDVAKAVNRKLKQDEEEDFVNEKSTADKESELKLNIVKHIISVRKDELKKKADAVAIKEKKDKIAKILAKKEDENLEEMNKEELEKLYKTL